MAAALVLEHNILNQGEVKSFMGKCEHSSGHEEAGVGVCGNPSSIGLSSVGGHGWSRADYDFSNFYLFCILCLPHVFLPFLSLTQKLRVVRPAGQRQEDDLFLCWSETTQVRIRDKQSNFSKEWHSGLKFPLTHLENLTELGSAMQSHFLCQ